VNKALLESIEAHYRTLLRAAIERKKKYPSRARRMHQEGSVLVSFLVYRDGHITDINILKSSSRKILDKEAMRAIKAIGQFQPIPKQIRHNQWQFEIMLEFALN